MLTERERRQISNAAAALDLRGALLLEDDTGVRLVVDDRVDAVERSVIASIIRTDVGVTLRVLTVSQARAEDRGRSLNRDPASDAPGCRLHA